MTANKYIYEVDKFIENIFIAQIELTESTEAKYFNLKIHSVIKGSGKRFRPHFFYLLNEIYDFEINQEAIEIGAAIELFHQALLVHDDVIDQDMSRNGLPNIIGIYNSLYNDQLYNQSFGILAGDYILSLVNDLIISSNNISISKKTKIIKLFNDTFKIVIYGQLEDVLNIKASKEIYNLNKLIKIASKKTACYTSLLPVRLFGICSEIKLNELKKLESLAECLGIYYQFENDNKDYFYQTNPGQYPKLADYKKGSVTLPYLVAQEVLSGRKKELFNKYFGNKELTKKQLKEIVHIMNQNNLAVQSGKKTSHYKDCSFENIDSLSINLKSKKQLRSFLGKIKA